MPYPLNNTRVEIFYTTKDEMSMAREIGSLYDKIAALELELAEAKQTVELYKMRDWGRGY